MRHQKTITAALSAAAIALTLAGAVAAPLSNGVQASNPHATQAQTVDWRTVCNPFGFNCKRVWVDDRRRGDWEGERARERAEEIRRERERERALAIRRAQENARRAPYERERPHRDN